MCYNRNNGYIILALVRIWIHRKGWLWSWHMSVAVSHLPPKIVYDSCQINVSIQSWHNVKCIDSITMNRYSLNISINSIMLLRTYEPIQSTHKNSLNDLIKSINQLNMYVDLLRKIFDFVDLFLGFFNQLNWFSHISPSKSIDSITYFMKTNWPNHQSTRLEVEVNQFNQFCRKNELIQINQLNWVDWCTYKYATTWATCSPAPPCYGLYIVPVLTLWPRPALFTSGVLHGEFGGRQHVFRGGHHILESGKQLRRAWF